MDIVRLYFHIPFCKSRCQYCDFNTYSDKDYLTDSYFKAMDTELNLMSRNFEGKTIDSVFFGGGTPTHVSESYIEKILERVNPGKDAEITIEANPGTVDYNKLKNYRAMGINRISFGIQSFNNNLLKIMGRIHDRTLAINNIYEAKRAGFENISIDLIFGYPLQTMDIYKDTMDILLELMPKHVSCYSLKIEEDTPLYSTIRNKLIPHPNDETDRKMYYYTVEKLARNDIFQYEISNFSKKGFESRHNTGYWVLDEYIGFGAGAHSFYDMKRWGNKKNPGEYIRELTSYHMPYDEEETISQDESMREFVILGLRMNRGINGKAFSQRYQKDLFDVYWPQFEECINEGLIQKDEDYIRLTDKGRDFANRVFIRF